MVFCLTLATLLRRFFDIFIFHKKVESLPNLRRYHSTYLRTLYYRLFTVGCSLLVTCTTRQYSMLSSVMKPQKKIWTLDTASTQCILSILLGDCY